MNDTLTRCLLFVAAAWNILGGIGALTDPSSHFAQMYHGSLDVADPVQLHFFYTVWIAVIAWGFAYLGAALQSTGRTAVLLAGAGGKGAYAAACAALFAQGKGTIALLAVGASDVLFAALFVLAACQGVQGASRPWYTRPRSAN